MAHTGTSHACCVDEQMQRRKRIDLYKLDQYFKIKDLFTYGMNSDVQL